MSERLALEITDALVERIAERAADLVAERGSAAEPWPAWMSVEFFPPRVAGWKHSGNQRWRTATAR